MKLLKLQLENFRNYAQHFYEFDAEKNIFILIGPNGKGKTNLLEAIYTLSLGKSFRTSHPEDLIEWEKDYLRCTAKIMADDEETKLEVFFSQLPRRQRSLKRNDVSTKNSEYIGHLLTVLFHPEDLNMLYLNPLRRRHYMNVLLSQTDRMYLAALSNYKKVLKQRNALLKQLREAKFCNAPTDQLEEDLQVWNEKLMQFGIPIIRDRLKLASFLQERLQAIYQKISTGKEKVDVEYQSKIIKNPKEVHNLPQLYEDQLFNRHSRDIMQCKTTAGPHRDDLVFYINNKEISKTASRGEYRTLLLAIKLAEIEYIREITGQNPILLLDDVFSELDLSRQKELLQAIQSCQTIITTTDASQAEEIVCNSPKAAIVEV